MDVLKVIILVMVALFMVLDGMARDSKYNKSIRFHQIRNGNAIILIVFFSFVACQN